MAQITDERLAKILSETQETIMEHNARCVRGSVEVDARLFESMITELQVRRKADSEPVIIVGDDGGDALSYRRLIQSFAPGTKLYRHAQPVPEKYNIGDATMRHIFTPTGMTNVSDMQAVFDRVEAVLVGMEQPAPVVPDDVSIFEAAIEECKMCDSIDEHAWNHGVLVVMAKYESCRAAMLQAGNHPAQSDCCPAQNSVNPAQGGNSLAIPDEMTSGQAYEIGYYYGDPVDVFARGANWMRQHIIDSTLAAAPQEVKGE